MVGAEGTSAYHRSRGRPVTRRGVADEVLREIRSRGPSEEDGEHDRDRRSSSGGSSKRLSCDEIDFILGDIRRRSRSRSRPSRPPPPTSLPPGLPGDGVNGACDRLPFGGGGGGKSQKEAKISSRRARRKRPKSQAGSSLREEGSSLLQNDRRRAAAGQDGKEWLDNPLYESKPQSRNAKPLLGDDGDDASSNPAGSSSSLAASCSSKPTELANDSASCEREDGPRRDDRGKDLNERLNDDEEGDGAAMAMSAVRRLKERLRDMGEELDRVRAAADKISVDIDELHSDSVRTEDKFGEGGGEEGYTVQEPDEAECEMRRRRREVKGGGGGLTITEVTSPRVPCPVIRPRPHSLWGEDAAAAGGGEGDDLFGKRYA